MRNTKQRVLYHAPPIQADELSLLYQDLLKFARNQLRNNDLAEDVVQEALTGAFSSLDGYQGKASLKTWAFKILSNKIKDEFRRKSRHPVYSPVPDMESDDDELSQFFTDDGDWIGGVLSEAWPTPEEALVGEQFLRIFQSCLEQLQPDMRRVFEMRGINQMEVSEICTEAGITANNCAQILMRARGRLSECLDIRWFQGE